MPWAFVFTPAHGTWWKSLTRFLPSHPDSPEIPLTLPLGRQWSNTAPWPSHTDAKKCDHLVDQPLVQGEAGHGYWSPRGLVGFPQIIQFTTARWTRWQSKGQGFEFRAFSLSPVDYSTASGDYSLPVPRAASGRRDHIVSMETCCEQGVGPLPLWPLTPAHLWKLMLIKSHVTGQWCPRIPQSPGSAESKSSPLKARHSKFPDTFLKAGWFINKQWVRAREASHRPLRGQPQTPTL